MLATMYILSSFIFLFSGADTLNPNFTDKRPMVQMKQLYQNHTVSEN